MPLKVTLCGSSLSSTYHHIPPLRFLQAFQKSSQKKGNYIADDCELDPTAVIRSSYISSGCKIKSGAEIINSLLLFGVTVREG